MRVQMFTTCLVDLVYPEVAERTVALLERLGCRVEVLLHRPNLVRDAGTALRRLRAPSVILIAGPSRTADSEQRMMLGVHAPRSLDVIVYG